MRLVLSAALAASMVFAGVTSAQAARGGGLTGYQEQLHFVSDTSMVRGGTPMSLCHLTTYNHAMFVIGIWRSSQGYALAANRCEANSFYPLSEQEIIDAKVGGYIPADVPDTPQMTMTQIASGFWGLGVFGAFLGFAAVGGLATRRRRKVRMDILGQVSPQVKAIIDAMCHAAKIDGSVADEEILEITAAAEAMTGMEIDPGDIYKMAEMAEAKPTDAQFKQLVKGHTYETRAVMMRGVLHVVAADGVMDPREQAFVGKLAAASGMDSSEVQMIMAEVVAANAAEQSAAA